MKKQAYPGFEILPQHRHKPLMRQRVELAPGVYAFVGYSSSNIGAIGTDNGYILVDTGDDLGGAACALQEIKSLLPGALQAVILTHSHPDHRAGAEALLEGRSDVPVWGHIGFGAEQKAAAGLEKISAKRAGRQFGVGIPDGLYPVNSLLPRFPGGKPGPLLSPNRFASEEKTALVIDGLALELHMLPGESADHLVVWLPGKRVLFSGDHIYRSFPNVAPIRGGAYRDIEAWARSLRRLLEFGPQAVMFGHTEVPAQDEIVPMISRYAEALEYVYAESVRGMNEGKSPGELAASLRLPEHLRGEEFLGEYYGTVAWTVRSIYAHKLGWFDGNAANLVPLAPREEAERLAALAGGAERLLEAAKQALRAEDYRWAARLADYLLWLEGSAEARRIKADALEALSGEILPVSGKNYLLRSAMELREK